ncbi:MAG: acyl-CoA/acyl-ACP dehydrogenase [Acidimicrobiales bacterium]|nr:acyl-CoA/acyl-ACP dehydrogenase [Acidimicrobiales bacterium]
MSELERAEALLDAAQDVVDTAVNVIADSPDEQQSLSYDVAHAASALLAAREMLEYAALGDDEHDLALAFVADVLHQLAGVVWGREDVWGAAADAFEDARGFVTTYRAPGFLARLGERNAPVHLDDDFALVRDTFRRFAEDKVRPHAEHVHRTNADVPEEVIEGLAAIGGFGLSIPEEYGGFAGASANDYLANVIATEELSRASLGIGGSLLTRPEILTRALVRGGTEDQKHRWLSPIAAGETLVAIAVTEPDYGSDVAGVRCSARRSEDGGWVIDGTKTWCTFAARADVLMLLARTDPSTTDHRGLSAFVVPKPPGDGHGFAFTQDGSDGGPSGGRMEGRAIDTIGYRGMHSYEVAFTDWWIPDECLIGGDDGIGRGFYLQMEGFENGRLQTAARAVGLMQAAYEAAREYAASRVVFGQPIAEYELTQVKLARMNVLIAAGRQLAYRVAQLMSDGGGAAEASMAKAYICRAAEWVAREALQIHGGMGYAEEYAVSRYYVDARVLSIFEGADETLCLKVITRNLVKRSQG